MTDEHHADRRRRAFLKGVGIAGAALSASPLLTSQGIALTGVQSKTLSRGDVAILRLLAAVELIEADHMPNSAGFQREHRIHISCPCRTSIPMVPSTSPATTSTNRATPPF
jgi:hypothetical protein